jgi:hypothetical protein
MFDNIDDDIDDILKHFDRSDNNINFKKKLISFLNSKGPSFFEIIIDSVSLKNLSRPKNLLDIKKEFLNF